MLAVCPRRTKIYCFALIALSIFLTQASADGQRIAAPEAIQDWVKQHWIEAQVLPPLGGLLLEIETQSHYFPSDHEIEKLSKETASLHPKDPKRLQYESYVRRKKNGPDVIKQGIAWEGPRQWRIASGSLEADNPRFLDVGILNGLGWKLTENWLVLMDSDAEWPVGHPIGWLSLQLRLKLGEFFYGGFRLAALRNLSLDHVEVHQNDFTVIARGPHGLRFDFEGCFDPALARGFVDRATIVESGGLLAETGTTWTFEDYRRHEGSGRWIAHTIAQKAPDGRLIENNKLLAITQPDPEKLRAFVTPPSPDQVDVVRGKVTPITISDYRGGRRREQIREGEAYVVFKDVQSEVNVQVADAYRELGRVFGVMLTLFIFAIFGLRKVLRPKTVSQPLQAS